MITGVALVLAGEALVLGLSALAIWLAAFVAVNALYLPLVEEPALRRRFGPDYDRYTANVRRWMSAECALGAGIEGGPVAGAPSVAGL